MKKIICDTNIFIHHFKNDPATVAEMAKIGSANALLPSIVAMELFRGMSNKNEMTKMKSNLKHYNLFHMDKPISIKALELLEAYRLSQDLKIPDAIIGAMAIVYQYPLFTYTERH